MPEVRTVFQPNTLIDVSDAEYDVLASSGLLAPDPTPEAATPARAVQPTAATGPPTTDAPDPAAGTATKKG